MGGIGKRLPHVRRSIVKVVQLTAVERVEGFECTSTIAHLPVSRVHGKRDRLTLA